MRIISIVTLFSPDGEYGGPVRVALNQARALREAGHEVIVAGGARGYGRTLPETVDGVPVRLFPVVRLVPGIGFAGLSAPALQRWLKVAARDVDVVHVHAARDFITLPAASWLERHGIPYVLQTHGMIDVSTNLLARPLDYVMTRRVLSRARTVFHLTERERTDLLRVSKSNLRLKELANGVPESGRRTRRNDRGEVLYLARLAPRKRPLMFVEMALRLHEEFPTVLFSLVGPNEGEADAVEDLIRSSAATDYIAWEGALAPEETIERMSSASVYVLPSVDEPYPMSVLEAMSVALPVVITDSCGLAPAVERIGCGVVVDASLEALVDALSRLLRDPELAAGMGASGARATREEFGMAAIATALVAAYQA
jgi:glycosyltransferase involved in cell wall biosynthesis